MKECFTFHDLSVGVYTSVSDCRESEEMGLTADHREMGVVRNKEGQESVCMRTRACVCVKERNVAGVALLK